MMTEDAAKLAERAVGFDQNGKVDAAVYFYGQAAELLIQVAKDSAFSAACRSKAEEYIQRAEDLKRLQSKENLQGSHKNANQLNLERAEFLLYQALNEDEEGNTEEAVDLYTQAIQLCLQTKNASKDNGDLQQKLTRLAEQSLERAEILKEKISAPSSASCAVGSSERLMPPLGLTGLSLSDESDQRSAVSPNTKRKLASKGNDAYTKEELAVLRATSVINGREYVPFMSVDLKERFAYPVPFTDKHGMLSLAEKQKCKLKRWIRPDEYLDNPKVFDRIDSGTIKQVSNVLLS